MDNVNNIVHSNYKTGVGNFYYEAKSGTNFFLFKGRILKRFTIKTSKN